MIRDDDTLLMQLATPANPEQAARLLTHPLQQATDYASARQVTDKANSEFWRRLAGSLRKALTLL